MTTLEELWPLFGLQVRCGPLEMRPMQDTDLPEVIAVVQGGVHDPERMPFLFPWTDATGEELVRNALQHYWRVRVETTRDAWSVELGVWRDGTFVGVQAVSTKDFPVTRTGETGSWLGRRFQGEGTGTLMRQAICVLCFDHLGFTELTSGAFVDNPESRAVSRKVGYVDNGRTRYKRRDALAVNEQLVLTPEALVRPPYDVEVAGVAAARRFLGIDEGIS
jgi:RimJ/RimL family protein N-acetyltransferase